jgi:signal transduction histidine kinase
MDSSHVSWLWLASSALLSLTLLGLSVWAYRRFPPVSGARSQPFLHAFSCYFTAASALLALFLWIKTTVQYAGVVFDQRAVFSLGLAGLLLLLITVIWLQVLFVFVHRMLSSVEVPGLSSSTRMAALGIGILASLPLAVLLNLGLPLLVLALILTGFLGLFDLFIERRALNLTWMAVWMALLSATAAYGLTRYSRLFADQQRLLQAKEQFTLSSTALSRLAEALMGDDSTMLLLSTQVPFTISEKSLRNQLQRFISTYPLIDQYYRLDAVHVVNRRLKQSVIEEQSWNKALPWLRIADSLPGMHGVYRIPGEHSPGLLLRLPKEGTFSDNQALCYFSPKAGAWIKNDQYDVSIFSAIFILLLIVTFIFIFGTVKFTGPDTAADIPFFDKPSLRNRIQLWLAGFTLGSFILIGWVSYTFFKKNGLIEENTMYDFLSGLLNLYVFLLLAALAVAVAVGNSITRPLAVIGEKLQGVHLGKNEPLEWSGQDEIGELVAAYNRMIAEVEASARELRRSEREGAWREMARQVAHEIKNPLTPMKLSIQYLQRAHDTDPQYAAQLIQSVTHTLIEQIDTLSRIAGEFSTFAQMPPQQPETFDVSQLAQAVSQLFMRSEQATVNFQPAQSPILVHADRTQITRVLNNLITNALQAIPPQVQGQIDIAVQRNLPTNTTTISVHDNGSGIPPELIPKVFSPNFTTKSSGMGLGLAICKNIIDAAAGKIWFETAPNQGTTFFVELPLASAQPHE